MTTTNTLAFNPEITKILWDREMSNQEKVGHIMSRCKFVRQGDMEVEEALKLVNLLFWATGVPLPRTLQIQWDKENRVAKLSFEKRDYFEFGQKYFGRLLAAKEMEKDGIKFGRRHICLSAERNPFWLVHIVGRVEVKAEEVEKVTEQVETPKVVEPTPKKEVKPKAVRNVERKKKPVYTEVPLEDDDE